MLTILVLFVGLTLATAVIAYWSDNLGKKLGKKRVSLWGMRPRTTATFLTIASSWLIMVFTLGVMLTIFPPLRQALLRFDEVQAREKGLQKSAKQLTGKVGNLDAQLVELRSQKESLEAQVANDSRRLKESRAKLTKSQTEAGQANKARQTAQKQAANARKNAAAARSRQAAAVEREAAARGNLQTVREQLGATRTQREKAEQQLKRAQTELKSANVEVENANARVSAANGRVEAASLKVEQAQTRVTKARENEKLAKENAEVARVSAEKSRADAESAEQRAAVANKRTIEAGKQTIEAGKQLIEAEKKIAKAQDKVAELQSQGEQLSLANAALLKANAKISDEADIILSSNIRVPVGRTLVERSFDKGVSFSEATEDLRALFGRAADKMVPGFLPGARLQLAPRLVPAPNVQEGDEQTLIIVRDDEIYNGLATAISRSQNSLSVRLVAERNHLEGEKILYARFIVVPIRSALPVNAELARATFDPKIGDARLFSALLKLVEAGREVAGQNGITPPLSPEAPDFYAPGSNEQIFEALRKVSAYDVPVRVRIVTATPIATTDQLRVRFEIDPLATTAQVATRKAPA